MKQLQHRASRWGQDRSVGLGSNHIIAYRTQAARTFAVWTLWNERKCLLRPFLPNNLLAQNALATLPSRHLAQEARELLN